MVVRAIVFDLDGTLIDSRRDIAAATNHALSRSGLATRTLNEIEEYVGDGARALLCRAGDLHDSDPRLAELLETFLDYYSAHPLEHTKLMPGAIEALDAVARFPLAICTNKPRRTTEAVLAGLNLSERFAAVNAGGDLPHKKPEPEPLYHLASELGVASAELMMIGDSAQDVLAGRAAGAITVGLRGGIQAAERLLSADPDHVLGSLHELPSLLLRL